MFSHVCQFSFGTHETSVSSYYRAFHPRQLKYQLSIASASTLDHPRLLGWLWLAQTSSNQFLPVVAHDLKGNSMACCGTSALDFNKRGCVRQI